MKNSTVYWSNLPECFLTRHNEHDLLATTRSRMYVLTVIRLQNKTELDIRTLKIPMQIEVHQQNIKQKRPHHATLSSLTCNEKPTSPTQPQI